MLTLQREDIAPVASNMVGGRDGEHHNDANTRHNQGVDTGNCAIRVSGYNESHETANHGSHARCHA